MGLSSELELLVTSKSCLFLILVFPSSNSTFLSIRVSSRDSRNFSCKFEFSQQARVFRIFIFPSNFRVFEFSRFFHLDHSRSNSFHSNSLVGSFISFFFLTFEHVISCHSISVVPFIFHSLYLFLSSYLYYPLFSIAYFLSFSRFYMNIRFFCNFILEFQ